MSSSVGMWVRADWRRRYLSLVALALVAGISFAVAVTAFAGARRTASSFDRLRESTRAYDNGVVIDAPGASPTGDDSYDQATVDRIRNLPQVESVGELVSYLAATPDDSWEVSIGLTTRGLRNCVVWQSVGVVAVSAVLGTAAGIAAGAAVWIATTDGIGVATDVNRPLLAIGMWSSIALAAAVLLGMFAGARAARLDVAESLRRE